MANGIHSDRQRLCRLCVSDQYELFPIFGGGIADLAEKIFDCTSVVINDVDGMPALICQQCRSRIVISHHFVVSCQVADRKYHRMHGSKFWKPNRLSVDSRPVTQAVKRVENNGKQLAMPPPTVPTKAVVKETVPAKHAVVQRLKNDDKLQRRRHSIDQVRKEKPKPVVKRRLSEESHMSSASIKQMAARIEQSLKIDLDRTIDAGREKCPKCGHLVRNLRTHLLLHSTVSKFLCEICNKSYNKASTLKYHMNLHSGERPYKCPDCGKAFSSPSKIWMHRQNNSDCASSHRRRKCHKYQCNGCKSVFKHRELIDDHMRTHHPEREYSCDACGKGYFTRIKMNNHRYRVHGKAQ
uniref:Putative ovo n=1 Tax=Culex tarsalis TaxID=7177 RepID=A0A1Q3EW29_CULTA